MNLNRFSIKPIGRIRVTEEVVDRIFALIQEGNLKEGDKLPPQKDLVEILKVSRPSLREAISGLVMLGVLEAKAGQGVYVRKLQMDRSIDFSEVLPNNQDERISYLYEMRVIIETAAAGLAAQRATEEDIKTLYAYIDSARPDNTVPMATDIEKELTFHQLVVDAAHNPLLSQYESTLLAEFSTFLSMIYTEPTSAERDIESQRKIVQRIEARDADGAIQAVKDHIVPFVKEVLGQDS